MKKFLITSLLCLALTLSIVGSALSARPVPVFVSILPQKYMVEQIGRDRVNVRVMVQPGASPATYEPKPAQMAALADTRLYFSIGVPFETFWLEKILAANPGITLVPTDRGIPKMPMAAHHHKGEGHHDHGEDHHHEQHHNGQGLDPHIWTSPGLVKIQADHILKALAAQDPANRAFYTENHGEFTRKIADLNRDLTHLFKDKTGTKFMVFHPAWGYFARDYGLNMIPIEIEGKSPKPAQLRDIIRHARNEGIKIIFVQPQFSSKSAELVAREIRGRVVKADPLAPDWMENMKTMAAKFKEALK